MALLFIVKRCAIFMFCGKKLYFGTILPCKMCGFCVSCLQGGRGTRAVRSTEPTGEPVRERPAA